MFSLLGFVDIICGLIIIALAFGAPLPMGMIIFFTAVIILKGLYSIIMAL